MSEFLLMALLALAPAERATIRTEAAKAVSASQASGTLMRSLPDRATVRLRCLGRSDGSVAQCVVIEESRPGLGFGEAAVALMQDAHVTPARVGGVAVDAPFEHMIDFTP